MFAFYLFLLIGHSIQCFAVDDSVTIQILLLYCNIVNSLSGLLSTMISSFHKDLIVLCRSRL